MVPPPVMEFKVKLGPFTFDRSSRIECWGAVSWCLPVMEMGVHFIGPRHFVISIGYWTSLLVGAFGLNFCSAILNRIRINVHCYWLDISICIDED